MCGRFTLYHAYPRLADKMGVLSEGEVPSRYNIPPGTWITAIRRTAHDESPVQTQLWWGYRPAWAKGKASQPINARVETVATSGYFRAAFQKRRCIVPADGWYEWDKTTEPKTPHYLTRTDREPIAFAGIYAKRDDGRLGCAIITEPARGTSQAVHERMPLILDDDSLDNWLDPDLTDRESLRNVVRHIDAELIEHWAVSTAVNKPGSDQGEELINPA